MLNLYSSDVFDWSKLLSVISVAPVEVKVRSRMELIWVLFFESIAKPEKVNPSLGWCEKLVAAKSFSMEAALLFWRFESPTSSD